MAQQKRITRMTKRENGAGNTPFASATASSDQILSSHYYFCTNQGSFTSSSAAPRYNICESSKGVIFDASVSRKVYGIKIEDVEKRHRVPVLRAIKRISDLSVLQSRSLPIGRLGSTVKRYTSGITTTASSISVWSPAEANLALLTADLESWIRMLQVVAEEIANLPLQGRAY